MLTDTEVSKYSLTKARPRPNKKPKYTIDTYWDRGPGAITGFHVRVGHISKVFYMRYTNPNNNKKRNYKIGSYPNLTVKKARSEAQKVYANVMGTETVDVHADRRAKIQDQTLAEYSRAYQKTIIAQASRKQEIYIHNKYIIPELGDKKLFEVRKIDIEKLRNKYEEKKVTANRIKIYAGKFFKWCVAGGYLKANPSANVKGFKEEAKEVKWSRNDIEGVKRALVKLQKDPENKVNVIYVSLLFSTGRRQMELCKLEWSQLLLKDKLMTGVETKHGVKNFDLDLSSISQFKALKEINGNSKWCFPSPKNPETHRGYFDGFWEKIRSEGNITQSMHDIRHFFARTLLNKGYDAITVGHLLGHKDGSMVIKVYGTDTSQSRKKALIDARSELLIA